MESLGVRTKNGGPTNFTFGVVLIYVQKRMGIFSSDFCSGERKNKVISG